MGGDDVGRGGREAGERALAGGFGGEVRGVEVESEPVALVGTVGDDEDGGRGGRVGDGCIKYDSMCARLVSRVELTLASALFTTMGAAILAWRTWVSISIITLD